MFRFFAFGSPKPNRARQSLLPTAAVLSVAHCSAPAAPVAPAAATAPVAPAAATAPGAPVAPAAPTAPVVHVVTAAATAPGAPVAPPAPRAARRSRVGRSATAPAAPVAPAAPAARRRTRNQTPSSSDNDDNDDNDDSEDDESDYEPDDEDDDDRSRSVGHRRRSKRKVPPPEWSEDDYLFCRWSITRATPHNMGGQIAHYNEEHVETHYARVVKITRTGYHIRHVYADQPKVSALPLSDRRNDSEFFVQRFISGSKPEYIPRNGVQTFKGSMRERIFRWRPWDQRVRHASDDE